MKKTFAITVFMLATLAWAMAQQTGSPTAQQPGSMAGQSGQAAPQAPGTAPVQDPSAASVVEGCLGGSNPNYTITDASGTTYKLNIPPTADTSKLAAHVGESVNVAGHMNGGSAIDVQGIGKGTGTCPAGASKGVQPPPKQ